MGMLIGSHEWSNISYGNRFYSWYLTTLPIFGAFRAYVPLSDGVQLDGNSSKVSDAALVMSSEEANEQPGKENKPRRLLLCSIVRAELVTHLLASVCVQTRHPILDERSPADLKVSDLASTQRDHTTISQIITHSVRSTFRVYPSSWTVIQTGIENL